MATYVNNLRLTELATGEGSGTWGTTTNTSLELIGEALGYNTQNCFASDADATTTVADGVSDPARSFYFKVTSSATLTATRTLTIAPNTLSRVMFIENATTGSQSIAISQGSGANVTIATGKTAVVYLDGAGSTAAVVDAMAGVDPGITDTLAEVLVAGNTSGANNLIIDNGQAITTNTVNETTAGSGVTIDSVLLKDDGVNATNLEITNLKANDGTSAGSIADSTGVMTIASSVLTTADINGGTIDGTVIGGSTAAAITGTTITGTSFVSSGDMTFGDNDKAIFGAGSDLEIFHDGAFSHIKDSGTGNLYIAGDNEIILTDAAENEYKARFNTNGSVQLYYDNAEKLATTSTGIDVTGTAVTDGVQSTDGDIKVTTSGSFVGFNSQRAGVPSAGGFQLGRLNFDAYSTGTTFVSGASIQSFSDGAAWTSSSTPAYLSFQTTPSGSTSLKERINVANNGDISFYEDTGTTAKFFWDASAESLGIGNTSPPAPLSVGSVTGDTYAVFDNGTKARLTFNGDASAAKIFATTTGFANYEDLELRADNYLFKTGTTERMRIDSSGNVGIGAAPDSGWGSVWKNLQVASLSAHFASTSSNTFSGLTHGGYYDGTQWRYNFTDVGATLIQSVGSTSPSMQFYVANSGTADSVITWTEAMRIDSSGSLLVGRTSTSGLGKLNVEGGADFTGGDVYLCRDSGNLLVGTTDSDPSNNSANSSADNGIASLASGEFVSAAYKASANTGSVGYFNRTGTDGAVLELRKSGSTVGSIGNRSTALFIDASVSSGAGLDLTQLAILPRKDGALNNGDISLGEGGYRYKNMFLSGGVFLGGTAAANKLDDYEEGTWTPALSSTGNAPTTSAFNIVNATYTKVGRKVHIQAYINVTFSNIGTGIATITGLPFTPTGYSTASFKHCDMLLCNGGYINDGTARIVAITDNTITGVSYNGTGTSRSIMLSGEYETNA